MANWLGGSLRAGQKVRNNQGGDRTLSKVVELNGNYRIYFPTFVEDEDVLDDAGNVIETNKVPNIRAAVVPGRTGDYKAVGTGFIPYSNDMYDVDSITGSFKDLTPLGDWARIARVLYEAQCAREKKNAEAEAERSAKEMGRPVDVVALNNKIAGIELSYHGGEAADGTKIMASNQPALSGGIVFKISTRVLVVRLDANDKPDWQHAEYAVYEISKTKADDLIRLLENKKYFRGNYLEVGYNYAGADKKAAGQNAKFVGIVESESLETQYPSEWNSIGRNKVEHIVTGSAEEQVSFLRARNRSLRGTVTPSDAISAYKKWCSTNQEIFGSIDFADENVGRVANLFLDNHLCDSMPFQLGEFQRLAEERKSNKQSDSDEDVSVAVDAQASVEPTPAEASTSVTTPTPSVEDGTKAVTDALNMINQGAENQTLRDLAQQSPNLPISADDDLGDL